MTSNPLLVHVQNLGATMTKKSRQLNFIASSADVINSVDGLDVPIRIFVRKQDDRFLEVKSLEGAIEDDIFFAISVEYPAPGNFIELSRSVIKKDIVIPGRIYVHSGAPKYLFRIFDQLSRNIKSALTERESFYYTTPEYKDRLNSGLKISI